VQNPVAKMSGKWQFARAKQARLPARVVLRLERIKVYFKWRFP
jgi:hypothetical protein